MLSSFVCENMAALSSLRTMARMREVLLVHPQCSRTALPRATCVRAAARRQRQQPDVCCVFGVVAPCAQRMSDESGPFRAKKPIWSFLSVVTLRDLIACVLFQIGVNLWTIQT